MGLIHPEGLIEMERSSRGVTRLYYIFNTQDITLNSYLILIYLST